MKKIAVITDSNSGITQALADKMGIFVIPMPFMIEGKEYFEGINLSIEEFFGKLESDCEISTSQPTPETLLDKWNKVLMEYDEIVHIPMSSSLSGSCQTATMLALDFDGKIQVVNNQRISVTQRQSVLDAMTLISQGADALQVKEKLEEQKLESSIYIMMNTLTYLKKGGRITPAAAMLGNLLKLKPVLQIQGTKLDAFAKARTIKQAKSIMIEAMKKDIRERFQDNRDGDIVLQIAHTKNEAAALELKEEVEREFPGYEIYVDHLSLSISCHIGPGSLAIACSRKVTKL